jgi:dTDP-glucose pyrophosphorylase
LRGEYELTKAIRELATSGKRVKALELTRESADVRDSEGLVSPNQTGSADTGLR